jgi:hypothetical protein
VATKINREELLRRLQSVAPGLTRREVYDQSSSFAFVGGKILTYNDEVACAVNSGVDPEIEGAVPAQFVLDALTHLRADEVDVYVRDNRLVLRGARQTYRAALVPEVLLPYKDAVSLPAKWRPLPPEFAQAVGVVARCTHADETKEELTCVHMHPEKLEATDSYHAARFDLKLPLGRPSLVKGQGLKPVSGLGVSYIGETEDWLHFANDKTGSDLVYSCRRYVQDYQDVSKFFDAKGTRVQLPQGLQAAMSAAEVASKENVDDNLVKITLGGGKLKIRSEGVKGEYFEPLSLNYAGPAVEFMIPPSLLAEIVQESNEVVVQTKGEVWKLSVKGEKWIYVTVLEPPPQREPNGRDDG